MSGDENDGLSRRRVLGVAGLGGIAGLSGFSGCLGAQRTEFQPNREQGGTFRSGGTSEAQSIHPFALGDAVTSSRLSLLYDAGAVINDAREVEGRWFETWDLSESADVVEYTLRDNLQWGGEYGQLTADDYLYSIEHAFQVPATENWTAYQYVNEFYIDGEPIRYEQTGDLSIRAELPQPRGHWLHDDPLLYVIPLPQGLLQEYAPGEGGDAAGEFEAFMQDEMIITGSIAGNLGPFQFDEWTRNSQFRLTRNDDYYLRVEDEYADVPYFDAYVEQIFDERTTGYSALETGDISTITIEARQKSQFENTPGIQLWQSEYGSGIFWLNLNHRINGWAPIRDSREVRQAFAHLFDKQVLINQIFQGNANPVDTLHPRWGPYYDNEDIFVPEPSIELAREKFDAGTPSDYGYEGERFIGPDGEQVELTMVILSGSQSNEIVANYYKQQLAEAGIRLTIQAGETSSVLQNYLVNSAENVDGVTEPDWQISGYNGGPWDQAASSHDWDLLYGIGFSHGANAPWSVLETTLHEQGPFNMWGYSADEYDFKQVATRAAAATTQEEATDILAPVFGFLSRDQPLVWSFNDHTIIGYRDQVGGLPLPRNEFSSPDVARELYFMSL